MDAGFHGEHTFFLHGIHSLVASQDFREWNEHNNACYFEDSYNLTWFKTYAQDNCLLEHKWEIKYMYNLGRPIVPLVLKMRIWGVLSTGGPLL